MDKESYEKRNITVQKNYYEILGCNQTASSFELKRNYQKLVKKYHPDKQEGSSTTNEKFILIDKAYKTLIDENSRKEYDASLLKTIFDEHFLIHIVLSKNELDFNKDDVTYYPCRCGENFVINRNELGEEECILECFQCSNCVLIK